MSKFFKQKWRSFNPNKTVTDIFIRSSSDAEFSYYYSYKEV